MQTETEYLSPYNLVELSFQMFYVLMEKRGGFESPPDPLRALISIMSSSPGCMLNKLRRCDNSVDTQQHTVHHSFVMATNTVKSQDTRSGAAVTKPRENRPSNV